MEIQNIPLAHWYELYCQDPILHVQSSGLMCGFVWCSRISWRFQREGCVRYGQIKAQEDDLQGRGRYASEMERSTAVVHDATSSHFPGTSS